MKYTQEIGREFWHDFDKYFRYDANQNGLLPVYKELGGDDAAANAWTQSRASENGASAFTNFVNEKKSAIQHLATAQEDFIKKALPDDDLIVAAFQDFAFGVLDSPDADHRTIAQDAAHTMSGGVAAEGYRNWQGFIEAALELDVDEDFWKLMQRANGMAWELHVRAHPGEDGADNYSRLSDEETDNIRKKWFSRTPVEIAAEFDGYETRAGEWR